MEAKYKVGDKVVVDVCNTKKYTISLIDWHTNVNGETFIIKEVSLDKCYTLLNEEHGIWFSEDMLQPVDDTSYGQVSYMKDTIDMTDDQLERNILDYAKEIDKILFPEKPDIYRIFQDRDTKAYIVDTRYRATIDSFSKFGLHPIHNIDKYIGDIVGYDPIELTSKSCGGVKSLIDLNRLWRQFYTDVHNKYRDTGTSIVFDPNKFISNKENSEDFKIKIIELPTIGDLNFKY